MALRKNKRKFLIIIGIVLILIIAKYGLIIKEYKEAKYELGFSNWTWLMPPFFSSTKTIDFIVDGSQEVVLKLWWEGISGDVEFILYDEFDNKIYRVENRKEKGIKKLDLDNGKYRFTIKQNKFTGGVAIGYENMTIVSQLDEQLCTYVSAKPDRCFNWDYILYVPEIIKHSKLLVVPNNTGFITDNYDIHKEKAKSLIEFKLDLSEELGVPLLVPVFPRPQKEERIYTHSLDRNTIYTEIESISRLDNQLISMIDDSRKLLASEGINIERKILMSGFSASGDFVDRFIFLHPDLVEAASIGGSDNVIPLESLRGEKLPYPIGIYDYERITGEKFNLKMLSSVRKLIYKGSEDGGGWQIINEDGKKVRYVWKDYYKKYILPILKEKASAEKMYTSENIELSDDDLDLIRFKALDGKILIDRFKEVSEIYSELGIDKTDFKIYQGIEHTINDEIKKDEIDFFKGVLIN